MILEGAQAARYARHLILSGVGGPGQKAFLQAKILVVGAGGLGSPLLQYLAAAGVGTLGIVDDDTVSLSNLQRQVIHGTSDIGRPKVESAADAVQRLNPDIKIQAHPARLDADNARQIIADYDLVADGSDNFSTRFLLNDLCHLMSKPLVSGAVLRFDGQVATFRNRPGDPCYRCLFPEPPPPGAVPNCAEAGVLGAMAGVIGTLQATEVLNQLLGRDGLAGSLLVVDAASMVFRKVTLKRDSACPLCGDHPTIPAACPAPGA